MTNPNIEYYPNGNKEFEEYRVNDKLHRDPLKGPASIYYWRNGKVHSIQYIVNGKKHRDPSIGPARILYHPNGQKILEEYRFNGKYHNPYGPAIIDYEYDYNKWFLNNICYTHRVNQYLDKHGFYWQNMDHTDFNIMWSILL